jgi:hypothetical protein
MGRLLIILLIYSWVTSCNFRVYENGHFLTRQRKLPKPISDSILTLSITNSPKIPDSATEISKIVIKAPFEIGYEKMVAFAKVEASKIGGNVIKITNYRSSSALGNSIQAIYFTAYKMNVETLSIFKTQLNSIKIAHSDSIKHVSIVHIKDYDGPREQSIFFNNTLLAKIKGEELNSTGKRGSKDFVFNQNGTLWIGLGVFDIKLGNEYYIVLYTTQERRQFYHHCELVDKDRFYFNL